MTEPILRAEDERAWDAWMKVVRMHSRTRAFAHAVDRARRVAGDELERAERPSVSWSGGKDSTVLTHLVAGIGHRALVVVSEKDDLDFPGEEAYVRELADAWSVDLRILRPPVSPRAWIEAHAGDMAGCEDVHGRAAGLSRACFYGVMAEADEGRDLVFLGLRAGESGIRRGLIETRGIAYDLRGYASRHLGERQRRCNAIGHWRGIDVYAYAEAHAIPLLPVYRCIGWLPETRTRPWLIRKSWWLPGSHAANGQAAWLRRYYPSLWATFRRWFSDAAAYA